jgi:hypothetical protein
MATEPYQDVIVEQVVNERQHGRCIMWRNAEGRETFFPIRKGVTVAAGDTVRLHRTFYPETNEYLGPCQMEVLS